MMEYHDLHTHLNRTRTITGNLNRIWISKSSFDVGPSPTQIKHLLVGWNGKGYSICISGIDLVFSWFLFISGLATLWRI